MSGEDDALSLPDTDNGGSLSAQARLRIALVLNLSYTFAELAAYYSFDSLAMLTDAVHNLSDVVAIVVAYRIEMLKNDPQVRRLQHGAGARSITCSISPDACLQRSVPATRLASAGRKCWAGS